MSDKTFKAGDKVKWDHSQGVTTGKVVKKVTSETRATRLRPPRTIRSISSKAPRPAHARRTGRRS